MGHKNNIRSCVDCIQACGSQAGLKKRKRNARHHCYNVAKGTLVLFDAEIPTVRSLALLFLLSLILTSPAWCADAPSGLKVFASVLPIQTFVEAVGGERVEAEVMVLPGQSPATYDPSPKQVAALAEADLYVRVGVPFEMAWMKRIQAANPEMPILDLRDGLPLRTQEAHTHPDEHGHHGHEHHEHEQHAYGHGRGEQHSRQAAQGQEPDQDAMLNAPSTVDAPSTSPTATALKTKEMDPHIWTSPLLVRKMAVAIRDTLSALDPAGAAVYARNQQRFDTELAALHQDLQNRLAGLGNRAFLVYHPAWGYFADTYELQQIPIERAGKEPGPRRLVALIAQAKAAGTRAIFVQPEFDQRTAQQIARGIGGRVEAATPLAADYADNLQRFAAILADANAASDRAKAAESPARSELSAPSDRSGSSGSSGSSGPSDEP